MTDAVLGIDVSKNTFDTNLGAGTKTRSKSFANSPDGWHHLIAWLGEHKIGHACLEATGRHGLGIARALHEAGRHCHVVERRTRETCVPHIFKRPQLLRATCSSPTRERLGASMLMSDGVGV